MTSRSSNGAAASQFTPPELTKEDERYPGHDPRYSALSDKELPLTESLALTIDRVIPYWDEEILPRIKSGERVIVAAHGNSLRALVKYLDNLSEDEILELNIPTGVPLVYEFDENFKPIKRLLPGVMPMRLQPKLRPSPTRVKRSKFRPKKATSPPVVEPGAFLLLF
ncbi:2,3-bisphosphoglycerate-dependent phosphoglycerate mutase [Serratia fonticola]|uniref:phosphoglycerate mutase (2,3-diphosphoglycerate-dependent) n=1 Tax=Serratia fonticola TaxID=47917 RepID=A0A4V6KPQ4_SERFO|nr:2,3-bisphosphoglycerate-dependent phosphoglycerate mutase [Serratia fonticola]